MGKDPREEFIELMTNNVKVNGFDSLQSRLMALIYAEPGEISLDALSKKTGYSLSAVSNAMKFIERSGLVERRKKPKSRKVYFFMEKEFISTIRKLMKKKYERIIMPSKEKLPDIIKRYGKKKGERARREAEIIKGYHKQVIAADRLINKLSGEAL